MKRLLFSLSTITLTVVLAAGLAIRPKLLTVSAPVDLSSGDSVNGVAENVEIMPLPDAEPTVAVAKPTASENITTAAAAGNASGLDLGGLYVLDRLFDNDPSSLLDKGTTSLKDLLVIDYLFNGGKFFHRDHHFDLGQLFTIDRLLGNGNGLLAGNSTSLSDLIVLEQLFNGSR
jgi:hypothetical protein